MIGLRLFVVCFFIYNNTIAQTRQNFQEKFNIKIILQDTFQSTFENVTYKEISKQVLLYDYISEILIPELKKYPKSYFKNIQLEQIVLCKRLRVDSQYRAAIPDPYKNTLLLSIDSFYQKLYLKHVLHHEIHHITEFALWQDMFYDWKKWTRKNTKAFIYGAGGSSAYEAGNNNINWYQINNPKIGFVNLYSTLGQEEDRCEIVALLMTNEERIYLKQFIEIDKNLKRKVNLTLRTLAKISNEKLKYWKAKLDS